MEKPYSAACENNKDVILKVLKENILSSDRRLLEIGSGTGQHAIYFAPFFPQLEWFPTDLTANLRGMNLWVTEAKVKNIFRPQLLDVSRDDFPRLKFDVVFTANTFHIMHWKDCKTFMKMLGNRLRENSRAIFYGPFKYRGEFTSTSNAEFDASLKTKDPLSGIRAYEDVNNSMLKNGFELVHDYEMPANNRILVYKRLKFVSDPHVN